MFPQKEVAVKGGERHASSLLVGGTPPWLMRAGRVAIGPVIAGTAALGALAALASCEALFPTHLDDAAADRHATDAPPVMDAAEAGPNPCLAATDDPASVLANVVAGFRATEGTMCPWEYGYFQDLADGGESAFTAFPSFNTASNEWMLPGTYAAAGSGVLVPDVNLRPDFRWVSTYTGTVDIEASVSLLQFPASEQALGIAV
jgi:hypothetical protein